jgi:hypothetical protein
MGDGFQASQQLLPDSGGRSPSKKCRTSHKTPLPESARVCQSLPESVGLGRLAGWEEWPNCVRHKGPDQRHLVWPPLDPLRGTNGKTPLPEGHASLLVCVSLAGQTFDSVLRALSHPLCTPLLSKTSVFDEQKNASPPACHFNGRWGILASDSLPTNDLPLQSTPAFCQIMRAPQSLKKDQQLTLQRASTK